MISIRMGCLGLIKAQRYPLEKLKSFRWASFVLRKTMFFASDRQKTDRRVPSFAMRVRNGRLFGVPANFTPPAVPRRNASFHHKHGHVSCMACITPVCAFALQFSRCWFAHSLKASTMASFDTNDFGHAEGIDLVLKSGESLMSFNIRLFVKTGRATLETNSKQKTLPRLPCTPLHCLYRS